jgi:hypothetical protein
MGYYISPNMSIYRSYSITKRGAVTKAKDFLKDPTISKVGIIRAEDDVLLITYSRNKDGLINIEKV